MSQNKQHVECDVKPYPISAANFNCIIRLSTDVSPVAILFRLFLGMAVTPEECCLQSAIMLHMCLPQSTCLRHRTIGAISKQLEWPVLYCCLILSELDQITLTK